MENVKVKIFVKSFASDLEDEINAFIQDKDVVNIQYQASRIGHSALITYKERKEEE